MYQDVFSRSVLSPPRRPLDTSARSESYALSVALVAALRTTITGSASSAAVVAEAFVSDCAVVDTDGWSCASARPFSSPSSPSSSAFCRQHRCLLDKRRKQKNQQRDSESRFNVLRTRNKHLHPQQLHRLRRHHSQTEQLPMSICVRACAQAQRLKTAYVWARH
jgi:hypothetical protein